MDTDARWIEIRLVVVVIGADLLNHRIDLDGVDVLGAPLQSAADVVAAAGADNQYVVERLVRQALQGTCIACEQVRQGILRMISVARDHSLLTDQVNVDKGLSGDIIDPVIGRPQMLDFPSVY